MKQANMSHIKHTEAREVAFGPCQRYLISDWCAWPECDCVSRSCEPPVEEGTNWQALFWTIAIFLFVVAFIFRKDLGL